MMKKGYSRVIVKLLILIIPIMGVLMCVEYKLNDIGPNNNYELSKKYFDQRKKSTEVLVLGNSQAQYGISPAMFPCRGFNLANISQSLDYDITLLQQNVGSMPQLKMVVLSFSYLSFFFKIEDFIEQWRMFSYYHYWNIYNDKLKQSYLRKYSNIAFYGNEQVVDYFLTWKLKPQDQSNEFGWIDSLGWSSRSLREKKFGWKEGIFRANNFNNIIKREYAPELYSNLIVLLDDLKKRGIKVAFVSPPVTKYLFVNYDPKLEAYEKRLLKQLSENYEIKHFDYTKDGRFTEADFFDVNHLNTKGARKLTKRLNEDFLDQFCRQNVVKKAL